MLSINDFFCVDCLHWSGRCLLGEINRVSKDKACLEFERSHGGLVW